MFETKMEFKTLLTANFQNLKSPMENRSAPDRTGIHALPPVGFFGMVTRIKILYYKNLNKTESIVVLART